jgi:hypothetical protein
MIASPSNRNRAYSLARAKSIEDLNADISKTHAIMNKNFQRLLERSESIEDLNKKTNALKEHSGTFNKSSYQLVKYNRWEYYKNWVMGYATVIGGGILMAVGVVVKVFRFFPVK